MKKVRRKKALTHHWLQSLPNENIVCILAYLDFCSINQTKLISKSFKMLCENLTGEEQIPAWRQFSSDMLEHKNSLIMEESEDSKKFLQGCTDTYFNLVKGYKWLLIAAVIVGRPVLKRLLQEVPYPLIAGTVTVVPIVWYGIQIYNLQKKSRQKKLTLTLQEEKMSELKQNIFLNRKNSSEGLTCQQSPNRNNDPSMN